MATAQPGIIAVTNIPGWPSPAPGLAAACQAALVAAGFSPQYSISPDGLHVSDVPTVTTAMAAFAGSATELAFWQARQQAALDAFFNANFDLAAFIRAGTATGITAANVGTFLATITNNYRSLRASIAAAANVAAVQAININAGWPSNP